MCSRIFFPSVAGCCPIELSDEDILLDCTTAGCCKHNATSDNTAKGTIGYLQDRNLLHIFGLEWQRCCSGGDLDGKACGWRGLRVMTMVVQVDMGVMLLLVREWWHSRKLEFDRRWFSVLCNMVPRKVNSAFVLKFKPQMSMYYACVQLCYSREATGKYYANTYHWCWKRGYAYVSFLYLLFSLNFFLFFCLTLG